ncbi:MAG TPA: DUF1592 domain-containing protein [Polyangiaceae bacterium]|nr:DUF1592 domain-containing protein [Polyangiaceae bacterium]
MPSPSDSGNSTGANAGNAGIGASVGNVPGGGTGITASNAGAPNSGSTSGAGNATGGAALASRCADPNAATADAGESVLKRLSAIEYQLSVQDLLALPNAPSIEGIPADTAKDGFKTFAEVQTVSAQHLRAYLDKASELSSALMADAARRSKVLGCEPSAKDCLKSFIARFGKQAYRRALESDEVDSLSSYAQTNAVDANDQFQYVIEAVLTSPNFLYRVEVGKPAEAVTALTPTELASRLSFSIWGRTPSAELLARAEQGTLSTAEGLRTEVQGMLNDPRAQSFYGGFFRQWLGYETLRAPTKALTGWSEALMPAMQAETDQVLNDYAWGKRNFLEVLTTNRSRVSADLAKFYGAPAPGADGSVEFPQTHVRANTGLLTHGSLLSAKSDGDLIAIRGNWIRRTFLCRSMEVPASVAEQLGELLVGLTRVQIVARRNTEAACKGCHAVIDPIGVGLSAFDQSGRFDATFDSTVFGIAPALPDAPMPAFATVAELSAKLRGMPEVAECLSEKLFLYVNGREATANDACTLASAQTAFQSGGQDFAALLSGLIQAPGFRLRRAPSL